MHWNARSAMGGAWRSGAAARSTWSFRSGCAWWTVTRKSRRGIRRPAKRSCCGWMRWTAWRLSGTGCSGWDGTQFVLTSNKHVRDWPTVFADDEILTTAILDRLLHHVQVLHIDGRSYRLRELGALLGPRPDAPTPPHPSVGGA